MRSAPWMPWRRRESREFDVLGVHVGSAEAVEIAHQAPAQVRRVIAVGMPLFSLEDTDLPGTMPVFPLTGVLLLPRAGCR